MADISLDLGSLTVGIDLPFIKIPSTTVGVGGYIPVTPAVALGGSLELSPRPNQIEFNLIVGVKILRFLEIEYQVYQWVVANPLVPLGTFPLPLPLPLPEPIPDPPDDGYEFVFPCDGVMTIYSAIDSSNFGSQVSGQASLAVLQGQSFFYRPFAAGETVDPECRPNKSYRYGITQGGFLGAICTKGGSARLGVYTASIFWIFTPTDPACGTKYLPPNLGFDSMTCTCSEISAIVDARIFLLEQFIAQRLACIQEDTRALRIGFQGQPQTVTVNYPIVGNGVTGVFPGDALQLVITPTTLPAGESQWLTEPRLYQLAILIPIFDDGNYGAPISVVVPFGTGCRIFVQFANIKRFAYSLLPGVSATLTVLCQTGSNAERPEWC